MALIGLRIVSGTVGSGKTYYITEVILQALKEGAQVHTNIDLIDAEIDRRGYRSQIVDLRFVDVRDMKDHIRAGDEKHPNILALDESALHFNVDEQNELDTKKKNKAVFEFLAWSRRYGLEIYFATQARANINVKLRRMSEYTTRCMNMDQVPFYGWLWTMIGRDFRRDIYLCDEDKEVYYTSQYAKFQNEVGSFYDTHGFCGLQEKQGIVLNKVVTRKTPVRKDQRNGKIAAGVFLSIMLAGGWYLYHTLAYFLGADDAATKNTKAKGVVSKNTDQAQPQERIRFVSRSPRLVVMADSGAVFARGQKVGDLVVTNLVEIGSIFQVTFDNATTQQITP